MRDTRIQWHPGFVAAMDLELKEASLHISNDIGSFFKGHNILEYKSPEDHLDIDTFCKTMAYAYLYKSYGKTLDEIKIEDITISIIREAKPVGLFRYLREHGYSVFSHYRGIYYIEGVFPFPVQVIVTGGLEKESHTWLKALSGKLNKKDIQDLLAKTNQITEKSDMANSVLEVSIEANRHIVEELIGDDTMFETLMEIMEPRINEIRKGDREEGLQEGLQNGRREGIQGTIDVLHKLKYKDDEIKLMIMEQYDLTNDEADSYLQS